MLYKYSEVLNLPVICAGDGKMAGVVKDALFSAKARELKALLLDRKGLETGKRLVYLKEILSLGKDAVVIDSMGSVSELSKAAYAEKFGNDGRIMGLRIFTKNGEDLGIVNDIIFDRISGRIESVEVSDGFIQDVVRGRSVLPLFGRVEFGSENVLVGREAVEEMINTGGGIKNILWKE